MAQPVKLGQPVNRRLGTSSSPMAALPEQLKKALAEQKGSPRRFWLGLIRLNFVNEDQLIDSSRRQYGVPSITLAQTGHRLGLAEAGAGAHREEVRVIPVRKMGNSLALAMADPTNVFALDDISFRQSPGVAAGGVADPGDQEVDRPNYDRRPRPSPPCCRIWQTDLSNLEVVAEGEEGGKVDVFELKESADEAPS